MPENLSENDILELLRKDPGSGLEAVVRNYSGYIMKIATVKLNSVCSKEDIEETVSDIFMIFFNSAKSRDFNIKSIKAYISVIARRHCINVFKKHCKKEELVDLDDVENFVYDESQIYNSEHEELIKALHELGEPDEEIFIRKYFLGQKSREISKELNIRTNTVDKKISRGLDKLRQIFNLKKERE